MTVSEPPITIGAHGEPAAPRATLPPSSAVVRLQGADIVRPSRVHPDRHRGTRPRPCSPSSSLAPLAPVRASHKERSQIAMVNRGLPSSSSSGSVTLTTGPSPSSSSAAGDGGSASAAEAAATKKVSSKEGTVDNEFLGRKSSKKCCIFHKEMPFEEDYSDGEAEGGRRNPPGEGGCSSSTVAMNKATDTTTELWFDRQSVP